MGIRKKGFSAMLSGIVLLIVGMLFFAIMAIFVFPGIGQGVKDFMGLAKSCKDPGISLEKYMTEVNDSLFILQGLTAISDTGQQVDIQIDADEFAIGVDQEMFICMQEGSLNQSRLEEYDSADFGPEKGNPPPRRMEVIYHDYIRNLAENGQPGSLKDIKSYITLYKKRFKKPEFKNMDDFIDIYKKRVDIETAGEDVKGSTSKSMNRVFEHVREQLDSTAAASDPRLVYKTHEKVKQLMGEFIFNSEFGMQTSSETVRSDLPDSELNSVIEGYMRLFGKYSNDMKTSLSSLAAQGKTDSEKEYNRQQVEFYKKKVREDMRDLDRVQANLKSQGKTQASNMICSQADKLHSLSYFGLEKVCGQEWGEEKEAPKKPSAEVPGKGEPGIINVVIDYPGQADILGVDYRYSWEILGWEYNGGFGWEPANDMSITYMEGYRTISTSLSGLGEEAGYEYFRNLKTSWNTKGMVQVIVDNPGEVDVVGVTYEYKEQSLRWEYNGGYGWEPVSDMSSVYSDEYEDISKNLVGKNEDEGKQYLRSISASNVEIKDVTGRPPIEITGIPPKQS
ncbi:MAG: hypothetical protein ACE5DM_00845 [Candidatus Nanoarchaeia archaeon]